MESSALRPAARFVSALLALVFLLAGCVTGPPAPPYSAVAAQIPPVGPGAARIYFYRDYEPYESLARPWIYLNRAQAAVSVPGGVSYRDVAPGQYEISVYSCGLYPNQFKTVVLQPGETRYVKIESLRSWSEPGLFHDPGPCDTFVVALIDEAQARQELLGMRYDPGL
jgi:hypothetical protein